MCLSKLTHASSLTGSLIHDSPLTRPPRRVPLDRIPRPIPATSSTVPPGPIFPRHLRQPPGPPLSDGPPPPHRPLAAGCGWRAAVGKSSRRESAGLNLDESGPYRPTRCHRFQPP